MTVIRSQYFFSIDIPPAVLVATVSVAGQAAGNAKQSRHIAIDRMVGRQGLWLLRIT
jgi:hypothetical protein